MGAKLHCPFCHHPDTRVIDSRTTDDGVAIRRRRECVNCNRRFSTQENATLSVLKRSGVVEPFSKNKVISGVRKACQGRPVSEDQLALLAQQVEESLRQTARAQINTQDIGKEILKPLRSLDVVAYLRFASVYLDFSSLEDFDKAIKELRKEEI